MIADELRRQADVFTDLTEFAVQNRSRCARSANSSRSYAFNALRPPADAFEYRPNAWELQGLTDS